MHARVALAAGGVSAGLFRAVQEPEQCVRPVPQVSAVGGQGPQ